MPRRLLSRPALRNAALAFALFACSSDQEKLETHLSQARQYQDQGKASEAMIELRNALKLAPTSAETNYQIGELLIQQMKYGDALFHLREAQRLDPNHEDAALTEARLLQTDDPKRADELVTAVLARNPSNPMAYVRRMEVALQQARTQDALAAAMTALELSPNDPLLHLQLGIVHQARVREMRVNGQEPPDSLFEQALAAYRKSDELYGGNPVVRTNMGKTYLGWGNHEAEAREAFRGAIESANARGVLADRKNAASAGLDFARIVGDQDFAEFALDQSLEADDSNLDAWAQLASLREAKSQDGQAVWKKLLERRPDDLPAHWRYSTWLFENGKGEEALVHVTELSNRSSVRVGALEMLSAVQTQLLKSEEANATIATMEREFPGDPATQLAMGRRATIEGRYADAVGVLRELSGKRESAEALRLLAVSEYHLGNFPAALAAVNRSLAMSQERATESLLLKARIHHGSRDWQQTIQTYTQIANSGVEISPRDLVLLANAFYEAGSPLTGKQILGRVLESPDAPPLASLEFFAREGEKSPAETRKYLEAALVVAPSNPGLINAMTRLDLMAGRDKEALDRLDKLIESGQATPAALLARARIRAAKKQYAEAEQDVNRVFEAEPNLPGTLELLLQIYAAQDKLEQALASFEEADRAGALSPGARVLLGRLYLSRNDRAKARTMFERALSERGDLVGAKNDLAFLLATDGVELERALTLAQEAQQVMANDPNVADTLGFVYFKKGLHEPALQQARYAVQLAEESRQPQAVYYYHLGLVLRALGRNDEATKALEQALATDPNFSEAGTARKELEAARSGGQATPSSS